MLEEKELHRQLIIITARFHKNDKIGNPEDLPKNQNQEDLEVLDEAIKASCKDGPKNSKILKLKGNQKMTKSKNHGRPQQPKSL